MCNSIKFQLVSHRAVLPVLPLMCISLTVCYVLLLQAAAATTANSALVFLAGDPLLPTSVVGSKLATSLATLFGTRLGGLGV